ncbi:MAG: hypothetical protein JXK94_00600 [Deltaproteobacteria bacterium]|nr:hypothetical protein [Deltaproteobacteria bacterium]
MLRRFGQFLIWFTLFILVLLAVDLSMIYIPSQSQGFNQVRNIYLDFRFRLLAFVAGNSGNDLDKFLRNRLSDKGGSRLPLQEKGPRFFYVDGNGEIRFVANLDEVPSGYRSQAQKLER